MRTQKITASGVLAALIFASTAYILHIPIPGTTGYIHLGDSIVFLAAALLPAPFAAASAAVGSGLCDLIFAPQYAIFTIFFKSSAALLMKNDAVRILTRRNLVGAAACGAINIVGYYLCYVFMLFDGNFGAALSCVPFDAAQAVSSVIVFTLIALALDKVHIKDSINKRSQ